MDQYRNLGGQGMNIEPTQLDGLVLVGSIAAQIDSAFIAEACTVEKHGGNLRGVRL